MADPNKQIKFLAIARRSDKIILASRVHVVDKMYDYVGSVNKVLTSKGWATVTTDKLTLEDGGNMLYILMDDAGRVYIAITSRGYPSRYIFSSGEGGTKGILTELKINVQERYAEVSLSAGAGGLNNKAGGLLKSLCDTFNDLKGIDKIASVQSKVDAVAGIMQQNIEMALKNTDRIEDIDEKTVVLADSALKFRNAGSALKRKMRCRYWKMMLMFGALIAAVIIIIIIYFTAGSGSGK